MTRCSQAAIPARLSATAGTFLLQRHALHHSDTCQPARSRPLLAGFIHTPYLPEQVAELLGTVEREQQLELHQRADIASMELATMVRAIEIAVATAASHLPCRLLWLTNPSCACRASPSASDPR